jgi:hypothetical protein
MQGPKEKKTKMKEKKLTFSLTIRWLVHAGAQQP